MNQLLAIKVHHLPVYGQKMHILANFLIIRKDRGKSQILLQFIKYMLIFCDNNVMGSCPAIKHSIIVFSSQFNSNCAIKCKNIHETPKTVTTKYQTIALANKYCI